MISLQPNTINFGEVVTKTPCDRNITIVNNHSADVLVQFDHTKARLFWWVTQNFVSSFRLPTCEKKNLKIFTDKFLPLNRMLFTEI